MPVIVTHLAGSRYARVLPHARGKLVASAFCTVALVALVASTARMYIEELVPISFERALAGSVLTYTSTYLALWIVSRARSALALIAASVMVILTLVMPLRFLNRDVPLAWAIALAVALWALVAAGLLLAPRLAAAATSWRRPHMLADEYAGGDEIALVLGTSQPWLLALGQIVPIVFAAYLIGWLYGSVAVDLKVRVLLSYLLILTLLSAATASFGAARSRVLWLRADWTRAELFARVEAAFWRRNGYVLGVLLITMVAVGAYFGLPNRALAFGLALLVLGTTVSTYLGLLITRPISWRISALAVSSVVLLLTTSFYATYPNTSAATIIELEVALGVLAAALRGLAQRRWLELDWMACRADRTARGAA
jgi:hypothetical protein